jgi:hypothetical protein
VGEVAGRGGGGDGGEGTHPQRLGAAGGAWFRRHGAIVVLVPPEQAADLRAYYAKHTKTDRLDSRVLARLPVLHPDGLHPIRPWVPAIR